MVIFKWWFTSWSSVMWYEGSADLTVKPCDSQTYWGTTVSLPSHQASLKSKQISHKIVNCFFLLWILANIPFLVHEMCTIRITKMFPQILSKPSSVDGMIPVWDCIRGVGQPVSIYQGSLCVANFIPGLKWELKAALLKSWWVIFTYIFGHQYCWEWQFVPNSADLICFLKPYSHVLNISFMGPAGGAQNTYLVPWKVCSAFTGTGY